MGSLRRIGKPGKAVLLVAIGAAGGGAALAVASVGDGSVIHACVQTAVPPGGGPPVPATTPNVQVIDPAANQSCSDALGQQTASPLNWNTAGTPGGPGAPGARGATGAPGANGKTYTLTAGNTLTIAGGNVITIGNSRSCTLAAPPARSSDRAIGDVQLGGLSFEILSFGFATRGCGSSAAGGGGGAGKVSVHDVSIKKVVDAASAKLSLLCANGKHIPKAKLTVRKAGKVSATYTFTDVLVSSYQTGGSGHGDLVPVDSVTLNFTKVTVN